MFVLDSLFVGGLRFVLEKIADIADRELQDPERWRALLLEAQLAFENGEIAQVLNVPEGTVKSRLNRGRAELARILKRHKVRI